MTIIYLNTHPLTNEKKQAEELLLKNCTLINKETSTPTCYGYTNLECQSCRLPRFNKEAKRGLIELMNTGNLQQKP